MPFPGELWRRLQFWLHRDRFSAELDEEMRLHTELRAEQLRDSEHFTDARAAFAARRRFGNATQLREMSRELWSGRWADDFLQDVRFALRQLRKAPSFTAVAVLSLALGIGANTAIFTLVNAVLLKSLPVRDPAGLLLLGDARGEGVGTAPERSFFVYSVDLYRHLEALNLFDGLAGVQSGDQTAVSVRRPNWTDAQPARAKLVSGNYFSVLGVPAALGRTFVLSDDSASALPVAVISFEYWSRAFGANPGAIGSTLDVSGVAVTVIGVAPPGFFGEKLQADPPGISASDLRPTAAGSTTQPAHFAQRSLAVPDWPSQAKCVHRSGTGSPDRHAAQLAFRAGRNGHIRRGPPGNPGELRRAHSGGRWRCRDEKGVWPQPRDTAGDHAHGAHHRLCQHRRSPDRARLEPPGGTTPSYRARRRSRTTDATVTDRELHPWHARWRAGTDHCGRWHENPHGCRISGSRVRPDPGPAGPSGARVYTRAVGDRRHAVRRLADTAYRDRNRSGHEGVKRAGRLGGPPSRPARAWRCPDRGRSRAVRGRAHGCRRLRAQLGEAGASTVRVRPCPRAHPQHRSRTCRLRPPKPGTAVSRDGRTAQRASWRDERKLLDLQSPQRVLFVIHNFDRRLHAQAGRANQRQDRSRVATVLPDDRNEAHPWPPIRCTRHTRCPTRGGGERGLCPTVLPPRRSHWQALRFWWEPGKGQGPGDRGRRGKREVR